MIERNRATAPFGQGRRLYEIRMLRGMSQGLLARSIGVSHGTIQNYERDRATMSIGRIEQLAHALNVEPADLLARPGSPMPKYRFEGDRPARLVQPERLDLWPVTIGFYSRPANGHALMVDVDRGVLRACGLAANAPGYMAWIDWMKRIHSDDTAMVQHELYRLGRTGVFAAQYRLEGFDGVEHAIVDCGRMSYRDGTATRLHGMMVDVTRMRRNKITEFNIALLIKYFRQT